MTTKFNISVIIPNLHSPIVDKTIESILTQVTDHPFEVIVVGMDKYQLVDPFIDQITYIDTNKPVPPGKARNLGVKSARGDYYFFIDSDCIAHSNWIEEHIKIHLDSESDMIVGGSVTFPIDNYLTLGDNVSSFHEFMAHIPAGEKTFVPTINMSVSKKVWEQVGGFNNQRASEDTEFCLRALIYKIKSFFNPEAKICHLPDRRKMADLFRHAYIFGNHSIKANQKFWKVLKVPFFLKIWWLSLGFSPMLAAGVILKIWVYEKLPLLFWHTLPVVYLLKIVWCFGYAMQLKKKKVEIK